MASLISESLKNTVNKCLSDLHETFAKDITIFKNAKVVAINQSISYNSLYGQRSGSDDVSYEEVSTTCKARIYFIKNEEEFLTSARGVDTKISYINGVVKIVVDNDGVDFLNDAELVEYNDRKYSVASSNVEISLFGTMFHEFFLIPLL